MVLIDECDDGISLSCLVLGDRYMAGTDVTRDEAKAYDFYGRACALAERVGCGQQGVMQIDGSGTQKDPGSGLARALPVCEGGSGYICGHLAIRYESGLSLPQDSERAAALYRDACKWDADGWCVSAGDHLARHPELTDAAPRAFAAWKSACAVHADRGCLRLAQAHECGIGVTADRVAALRRYAELCGPGDPTSCQRAGWLLARVDVPAEVLGSARYREMALVGLHQEIRDGSERLAGTRLAEVERLWPEDPRVAFVRACRAVDRGDWVAARGELDGPLAPSSGEPAVKMLAHLVRFGEAGEAVKSREVMTAWAAEGQPKLEGSHFLPLRVIRDDYFVCGAARGTPEALASEDGFLRGMVTASGEGGHALLSDAFLAAAERHASSQDRAVRLVALFVLTNERLPASVRTAHEETALRVVRQFAEERPDDLLYAIWQQRIEGPERAPFTLARAAQFAEKTRYGVDRGALYQAMLAAYAEWDGPTPAYLTALLDVFLNVGVAQWSRGPADSALAGAVPDRAAWGRHLVTMGQTVSRGGWLVDLFVAQPILKRGSELTGRAEDRELLDQVRERAARFHSGGESRLSEVGLWPLRSVSAEWQEATVLREMEFFEELSFAGGL